MTKKHYILLAELIKDGGQSLMFTNQKRLGQYACLTADRLAKDNPKFCRITFLRACGVL